MTGLSIGTLAEALARCSGRMSYAGVMLEHEPYDRYERLHDKLLLALRAKSERYAALETIEENADRLARAAEIVLSNLAQADGDNWLLLYDVLRSRLFTYTEARFGLEAAQRFARTPRKAFVRATLRIRE